MVCKHEGWKEMKVYEILESSGKHDCKECKGTGKVEGAKCNHCDGKGYHLDEAHGNSKVYDKCWDGYKKVPGKKRGEKGSCVKESVVILEEQFDRIEEMVSIIAEAHGVDAEVVWEDFESLSDDELYTIYEDWQKVNKKDKTDGMSRKAVKAYRRENPGSKLKTAVTTKPSKLKRGSKASKRRKSFCARSNGQKKMHNIDCSKTPDKAICKARRRWNC